MASLSSSPPPHPAQAAAAAADAPIRAANGNLVRTREWHQIKCFHQYLMVRPHQAEWKALHQPKAQWLKDMQHYSPSLRHDRAVELFAEYFERVGPGDLWRMRFNRRSANPLEWISVDFFSKGRALDPMFLRFLMAMTWNMKTPAFRAAVPLEEFTRDRTEAEDKAAKDTFLLAHRFLYDSCPQGLELDLAALAAEEAAAVRAQLAEWEREGLVTLDADADTAALARETLDRITYDSPLLPHLLTVMGKQRPDAKLQYKRIIAKEANSRTCFFRLYKEARFLTLFGPLKPELAALIDAAPASYYASGGGGGGGGGATGSSRSSSSGSNKRTRTRGSVYRGFKKRGYGAAASPSSSTSSASSASSTVAASLMPKVSVKRKQPNDDFYYYDDNDMFDDDEEEEEDVASVDKPPPRRPASSSHAVPPRPPHLRPSSWTKERPVSAATSYESSFSSSFAPAKSACTRHVDEYVQRWFPHEGDAKTMYEPPVNPDDPFEKWYKENMVATSSSSSSATSYVPSPSSSLASGHATTAAMSEDSSTASTVTEQVEGNQEQKEEEEEKGAADEESFCALVLEGFGAPALPTRVPL